MPDTDYLEATKSQQREQLVLHLNAMTYQTLTAYPSAEVESWTIQKGEAEAILSAGNSATLEMAPFITRVCVYHHGPSDAASRLAQVKTKAAAICANADSWAEIAAFVNGLRARTQEAIAAATSIAEVMAVMNDMRIETEQFRNAAGI